MSERMLSTCVWWIWQWPAVSFKTGSESSYHFRPHKTFLKATFSWISVKTADVDVALPLWICVSSKTIFKI